MSWVIRRTDQGGGYVAPAGQASSYVRDIRRARKFESRIVAEVNRCPDNEVVEPYDPERT